MSHQPIDPPKWPARLLSFLLKREYLEEIEGDMIEEFYYHQQRFSIRKARYLYCRELFKLLRPNLIKNLLKTQKLNYMGTISNYTKVAFRNIRKHRTYSAIKIGGFSIGIAISLLISLFVLDELGIDQQLKEESIYRMVVSSSRPDMQYQSTSVPPILGPSLKQDYPELKQTGRILIFDGFGDAGGNLFRPSDRETRVFEERFGYADPSILEMLEFKFTYGNAASALSEPRSLILSASKANKYFPDEDPIGKTIFINENKEEPYTIGGVFQDLDGTHLSHVDFFFTLVGKEFWEGEQTNWCCYNYVTYFELKDGVPPQQFEDKLKSIYDRYFLAYAIEEGHQDIEDERKYMTLKMQHVSDIYLHSSDIYDFRSFGDIKMVAVFGAIAIFILLLACMNFVNLTTANSAQRSKEIGLRKAVGSGRKGIMMQFLIEAMVLTGVSVVIGTVLAFLVMPFFNAVADKHILFPWADPLFYLLILGFTLIIGMVSGAYPALYLSSINTIAVLGGQMKLTRKGRNSLLRSGLVVFQFMISMILIAGALIVYQQMSFILNKDLGYDKEQVLMIHGVGTMGESLKAFKGELESLPEVQSATVSNSLPVEGTHRNGNGFWLAGQRDVGTRVGGQFWRADEDYLKTLGLELVEGRMFSKDMVSDSNAVVVNEAMIKGLSIDDPLNTRIQNWVEWKIVGVVKDFNYDNLREEIRPLVLARGSWGDMITLRLAATDMRGTLDKIEGLWDRFNPNQPIRTDFLDQRFEVMYEDVQRTRTIFLVFAVFGVIVACLGLFGLSVYTVALRNKEMTIRKVLGASVQSILRLLTIDYLKLVVLSMVIAVPVAWYFADEWLAGFSYRIETFWDTFIYGGILLVVIALGVVSFQSLKAAFSNPSTGLRNE
ncbi:FtsX-like permease family protein [Marinoscillum sp.]|uniref:FtsX-like permease family protein n=1 Tax=Marinoscillum sp. TaxID=2024838 RepID=UPI003BAD577E